MARRRKVVIGCTEPSYFTNDVIRMIELFYKANPIKLCQNDSTNLRYWLDQCDAVILSGGKDIHPRCYGFSVMNEYGYSNFDVDRDHREIRIINYCFKKKKPMFGICRGHQMLGIRHKVRFIPDLSGGVVCHQPMAQKISHDRNEPMHWVQLLKDADKKFQVEDPDAKSLPSRRASDTHWLWVNSFHHQGLYYEEGENDLVEVLGITSGTRKHQIIELMRGKKNPWLSCQWHPEYDWEFNAASRMVLTRFAEMIKGSLAKPPVDKRAAAITKR